jgi:hypothetical protein
MVTGPVGLSPRESGGDDEDKRSLRRSQHLFDAGRVEQAERGVQGLAETSVGVVERRSACTTTRTRSWRCSGRPTLCSSSSRPKAGITRLSNTLGVWPTGWISARKPSPRSANRSRWRGWIPGLCAAASAAEGTVSSACCAGPGRRQTGPEIALHGDHLRLLWLNVAWYRRAAGDIGSQLAPRQVASSANVRMIAAVSRRGSRPQPTIQPAKAVLLLWSCSDSCRRAASGMPMSSDSATSTPAALGGRAPFTGVWRIRRERSRIVAPGPVLPRIRRAWWRAWSDRGLVTSCV